jgi:hypothetical protein
MPQADAIRLLDLLLPFAQQCLEQYGQFLPFGAHVDKDRKAQMSAAYTGEGPSSLRELMALMTAFFRKEAAEKKLRAAAMCFDVRRRETPESDPKDAICIQVDLVGGECGQLFMPYRIVSPGKIEYSEMSADWCERWGFAAPNTTQ